MEAGRGFDREKSLMLKGIAIVMMVFHHCFRKADFYRGYAMAFAPLRESQVINLAQACKLCVSIFAFISGYGLFLSYRKTDGQTGATRWCVQRYVRTFSGYWLVWLLTAVICQMIDGLTGHVLLREGACIGLANGVIDFLGLGSLFRTPTLIGPAWYMSAAAVYILLMPAIYRCRDALGILLVLAVAFPRVVLAGGDCFPGTASVYAFITPFLLGCMFARYGWFERWNAIGADDRRIKGFKCTAAAWLVILGYKLYHSLFVERFWEYHYGLYAVPVILLCEELLPRIPGLRSALRFLGRHSMNVFLTHITVLHYFRPVIMGRGHFALCVLTLTAMSVAASIAVEGLKKLVRYQRFVGWLEARI